MYYNAYSDETKIARNYMTTKSIGGGHITQPLRLGAGWTVETPLATTIRSTRTYGYYLIRQLRDATSFRASYYDIWILATRKSDENLLLTLDRNPNAVKCCFNSRNERGDRAMSESINGFARLINYYDIKYGGRIP